METLSIRELIDMVGRGQIRIPAFQRGFVWEPERVAYLMDSIYKGYPFGSLMFWRTREQLKFDKEIGPFVLPSPKEDYPVDYVLDGQQRVTSIFGVFQQGMKKKSDSDWLEVYYDLEANFTPQDTRFVALKSDEVVADRHFPLNTLFDSAAYRSTTEGRRKDVINKLDEMQERFKEARIPFQISKTEDKATVAIIFERVNRQGVDLNTLQLLSAWTWSEDFQLQDQFEELAEELSPFGFEDVGGDTDLLLRCCSAVLSGDASPNALMQLNGTQVRQQFDRVTNGVRGAVDFLRKNLKAESLNNLPFSTLLVPLAVFFAASGNSEVSYTDSQKKRITRWFWRSAFSKRYSSGVLRNLKTDILQMNNLREDTESSLGEFPLNIEKDFFTHNKFGLGNVNSKTFILMLAQKNPVSFVSGSKVDLAKTLKAANRSEFHHIMPKDFLKKSQQADHHDNILANICFLSRTDNRRLGGRAPSLYKSDLAPNYREMFETAFIPDTIFTDSYSKFVVERAAKLAEFATSLCM